MKIINLSVACLVLIVAQGCVAAMKRTKVEQVKTGLSHEQLMAVFAKVEKHKTTKADLEKMGVKFSDKNIQKIQGAAAFRELFGQDVFRDGDMAKMEGQLSKLDHYLLYQIPFKDVTTVSDRIYLNKKVTTVKGQDTSLNILFKDNIVEYVAEKSVTYDSRQEDRRTLGGLVDLFGEVGSAASALKP